MGKYLEALKIIYADDEKDLDIHKGGTDKTDKSPFDTTFVSNVSTTVKENENFQIAGDSIPFNDHDIAEHKVEQLQLRDDRVFLRRCLVGFYGSKRLEIVNRYYEEWQKGMEAEPSEIKKDNAGRKRANIWLRLNHKER